MTGMTPRQIAGIEKQNNIDRNGRYLSRKGFSLVLFLPRKLRMGSVCTNNFTSKHPGTQKMGLHK